ncbi:hypothetical protein RIF29_19601 [Crotalaria pallida]|uniref:Uncharacterized protein n=1 Tax=Crotalaria pallida TaxID=3830 RepID=A0AAN9EZS7_CROPI
MENDQCGEVQNPPQKQVQPEEHQNEEVILSDKVDDSQQEKADNDWQRVTRQRGKGRRNSSDNLGLPDNG